MLITKKMMQDMKKNSNLLVCDECGSEDIEEQVWVDINSYLVLDNKTYAPILSADDEYFCPRCCNETGHGECSPITFEEYMEAKNESNI